MSLPTEYLTKKKHSIYLAFIMLISSFLVYIPFLNKLSILSRFFDGPLYAVVARFFYSFPGFNPPIVADFNDPKYFACDMPLYPLLIKISTIFTGFYYPPAIIIATLISSIICVILFYHLLIIYSAVENPFYTAALFCFFPARWLIYHSLGASEPLFLCFVFSSFILYKKGYFWSLVLTIACASLTRIVGVLLGPTFLVLYLLERQWKKAFLIPISGIGILLLFSYYKIVYNDFFAYFSKNLVEFKLVQWPPLLNFFSKLGKPYFWDVEYLLALIGMHLIGVALCWKKREFFVYSLIYFVFFLFIYHIDLSRYLLPISWACLLIGFDPILCRKPTKIAMIFLIPFFYFYVWQFIPTNLMDAKVYQQLLYYFSK